MYEVIPDVAKICNFDVILVKTQLKGKVKIEGWKHIYIIPAKHS